MGSIVGHEQAQAPKQRVWPLQWPCAQLQACMLTHRGLAATPWHLLTQAPTHLDKLVARGSVVSDQPLQRLWAASDAIRCRVHDHHTCEQQPRDGSCRHTDVCTSAALRASRITAAGGDTLPATRLCVPQTGVCVLSKCPVSLSLLQ